MKVRVTGKALNSSEASVKYLTFSAEDDDERETLTRLYNAYVEGSLALMLEKFNKPPESYPAKGGHGPGY